MIFTLITQTEEKTKLFNSDSSNFNFFEVPNTDQLLFPIEDLHSKQRVSHFTTYGRQPRNDDQFDLKVKNQISVSVGQTVHWELLISDLTGES